MNRDEKERMNQSQHGQKMGQNPDERKQAPGQGGQKHPGEGQGGQKEGHKPGQGKW